jgi:hypothetical protein
MFLSEKAGLTHMLGGHHDDRRRPYGDTDLYGGRTYAKGDDGYARGGSAYETRGQYRGNDRHGIRDAVGNAAAAGRNAMSGVAEAGRNAMGGVANAGRHAMDSVTEAGRHAMDTGAQCAESAAEGARGMADQAMRGARRGAEAVGSAVAGAADTARGAAAGVSDRLGAVGAGIAESTDHLMHRAQDFGGMVGETGAMVGHRLYDTARETPRKVQETVVQARESLNSMVGEQPLIAGAVGLAIGAVIAAALPKTEAEDKLMGEAADHIKDAVGTLAADQMEQAKTVATTVGSQLVSDVASKVGEVAEEHGINPEGAKAALAAATDKLKEAVGLQGSDNKDDDSLRSGRF